MNHFRNFSELYCSHCLLSFLLIKLFVFSCCFCCYQHLSTLLSIPLFPLFSSLPSFLPLHPPLTFLFLLLTSLHPLSQKCWKVFPFIDLLTEIDSVYISHHFIICLQGEIRQLQRKLKETEMKAEQDRFLKSKVSHDSFFVVIFYLEYFLSLCRSVDLQVGKTLLS